MPLKKLGPSFKPKVRASQERARLMVNSPSAPMPTSTQPSVPSLIIAEEPVGTSQHVATSRLPQITDESVATCKRALAPTLEVVESETRTSENRPEVESGTSTSATAGVISQQDNPGDNSNGGSVVVEDNVPPTQYNPGKIVLGGSNKEIRTDLCAELEYFGNDGPSKLSITGPTFHASDNFIVIQQNLQELRKEIEAEVVANKTAEIRKKVTRELKRERIRGLVLDEQEALRKEFDIKKSKWKADVRDVVEKELRADIEKELRVVLRAAVAGDFHDDMRKKIAEQIRSEIKEKVLMETSSAMKAKIRADLMKSVEAEIRSNVERDLRASIEMEIKQAADKEREDEYNNLVAKIESDLRKTLDKEFHDKIRQKLRVEIRNEVELEYEAREAGLQDSIRKAIERDVKKDMDQERREREQELKEVVERNVRQEMRLEYQKKLATLMQHGVGSKRWAESLDEDEEARIAPNKRQATSDSPPGVVMSGSGER